MYVAKQVCTQLKALAATYNNVPFYAALHASTIDWKLKDEVAKIPVEERGSDEVKYIQGLHDGELCKVLLTPEQSNAANFAFDVTPAKYVTGIITEKGVFRPEDLHKLNEPGTDLDAIMLRPEDVRK